MAALKPADAVDYVVRLAGSAGPAGQGTIAGSCIRAMQRGDSNYSDLDWFVVDRAQLLSTGQHLFNNGAVPVGRYARIWERWNTFGVGNFWTNSMQFEMLNGLSVNLVFKTVRKQPIRSTADVLGSFDFGFLCEGYDLTHGKFRSMISFQFPDWDGKSPLGMVDGRWKDWSQGYMSQHVGLREGIVRYPKYHRYGEDMSLIGSQLVQGYDAAAEYLQSTALPDKMALADIYLKTAEHIVNGNIDALEQAQKAIVFNDELDAVMEALE